MLKNYIKTALRNIRRSKIYSFINILGLAVGMAVCFLILLYVRHEFSFDRFHEKADQIYRINTEWLIEGQSQVHETTAAPVAPALLNDFPEVQKAVRFRRIGATINQNGRSFEEQRVFMVDPSFFEMFTFPLVQGDPETALSDKTSMVITEEMAEKYFGDRDPLGQALSLFNRFDFKITGIARNIPSNSYLQFDFLIRFDLVNDFSNFNYLKSWGAWNFTTCVLLPEDYPVSRFTEKSIGLIKKYRGEDSTNPQKLHLQPLTSIYLQAYNRINYIYFFSAIAAVILLLACINFMNLSIAQSSTRAREVGMRKVIGALRHQLVRQFIGESMVLTFLAFPIALILVELFLPSFNALFMTHLRSGYIQNLPFIGAIIGIALLVSLVSGSYPAFYQSALRPVQSLKGEFKSGAKTSLLRSLLVVFQFSVSIILIISTLVIFNQMRFIKNRNLGFDRDYIVNVPILDGELRQKRDYIKAELLRNTNILNVSVSSFMPGSHPNQSVDWEGRQEDEELMMAWYSVDYDFLDTFQIELLEGREFSRDFPADIASAYILNQAAVNALGWDRPVGKGFWVERAGWSMGRVVGVMKNFHFDSLHHDIQPLALVLNPEGGGQFSLKIDPWNIKGTLSYIEGKFKEFAPHVPYKYTFLDNDIQEMYTEESRLAKIINALSVLAVFIGCLGLLGLASFAITQRTKEIGIRKVLGASIPNILTLLSKDFTRLVVIANVIAWPIAYYAMSKWLQNFAYRTPLNIWVFMAAGVTALVLALLTIGFKSFKAATANPADSLRYE